MTPTEILDLDSLLAPISDGQPCGFDGKTSSSAYSALRVLREEAEGRETQASREAAEHRPALRAEAAAKWAQLLGSGGNSPTGAIAYLQTTSKDMRVAAWMFEALIRSAGFPGIETGLRLVRSMHQRYWGVVFPGPDPEADPGEEYDPQFQELKRIDGTSRRSPFREAVGQICVFPHPQPISMEELYKGLTQGSETESPSGLTLAPQVSAAIENWIHDFKSGKDFDRISVFLKAIQQSQKELQAYQAFVNNRVFGTEGDSPQWLASSNVADELRKCEKVMTELSRRIAERTSAVSKGPAGTDIAMTNPAAGNTAASTSFPSPSQGRAEALRQIRVLAAYFRSIEPHSPISYLLEQAVRWGGMPLPVLWQELLKDVDAGARNTLFDRVGFEPVGDKADKP